LSGADQGFLALAGFLTKLEARRSGREQFVDRFASMANHHRMATKKAKKKTAKKTPKKTVTKKAKPKKPKAQAKAKAKAGKAKAKPKTKAKRAAKTQTKKKSSFKGKQPRALPPPPVEGTLLGRVDDFFAHINVIALTLKSSLQVGNAIHVKGHTTDFTETVASMQIDHEAVQAAQKGESVGIKISGVARKRDWVFRVD
jgi:putative protease